MRVHRHQLGKRGSWHSVRAHHDNPWDWCAHHEEVERHLSVQRHKQQRAEMGRQLEAQAAH